MNNTNNKNINKNNLDQFVAQREIEKRANLEACAHLGALEWNIETGDFWWSQSIERIFHLNDAGLKPSLNALLGFIHPADQHKVQQAFEQVAQGDNSFRIHTHVITSNGKETPVLIKAQHDVSSHKIIGYIQDISEDFNERASLLETLAKYRAVMSSAGDAILLMSREGNILEGNPKAAELLEVSLGELANLCVDDIHLEDDLDMMMGHYQGFLWGQNQSAQSVIVGKEGRLTSVEITGRPISIDKQQMLVVILHDITLQQKAQNALIRSEQRYRSLVDEAREGILLLDSDGNILASNPKLSESTGLKRSVLLRKNFHDIADFDLDIGPTDILKEATSRTSIHMEGYLKTIDDKLLPTGFNVARYKEQGQVQFIVTAYDLTTLRSDEEDRMELQKQLFQAQKQELLGQVAGSLAHDFNNLLSPILLVSEMLMEDAEDNEFLKNNLYNINQAAQRARRLVRRILTYTRPEESEPARIDLRHELGETLSLLRSSVPQSITIKDTCEDGQFFCFADPDQIHQVIMNIGMNAAQAIGDTKGIIDFKMEKIIIDENSNLIEKFEIPEGEYAKLYACDSGPGIPQDIAERIFEPFFTTKSQTDGSGLGLSVVKQIIDNHGGAVEATNANACERLTECGESGACISIYLPLLKE